MFKTVLASLMGSKEDAAVLEAAHAVAGPANGHITGLFVRPSLLQFSASVAVGHGVVPVAVPEYYDALEQESRNRAAAAHAAYNAYRKAHDIPAADGSAHRPGVSAEWIEREGDQLRIASGYGWYSDLVICGRSEELPYLMIDVIGSLVFGCGKPVLIPSSEACKTLGRTVAIAWKETPEAARAVAAAMPMLEKAEKVIVLTVPEDDFNQAVESAGRLAKTLEWHGIAAETRTVDAGKAGAAEALLSAATGCGADLLVMGAYGHSRLREFVFGGFTREILKSAPLPVMLVH